MARLLRQTLNSIDNSDALVGAPALRRQDRFHLGIAHTDKSLMGDIVNDLHVHAFIAFKYRNARPLSGSGDFGADTSVPLIPK